MLENEIKNNPNLKKDDLRCLFCEEKVPSDEATPILDESGEKFACSDCLKRKESRLFEIEIGIIENINEKINIVKSARKYLNSSALEEYLFLRKVVKI